MDIRRRLYPYPVLSSATDDYIGSSFDFEIKAEKGLREICLSVTFSLSDSHIQELINEGKAKFALHIECPHTAFRTVLMTDGETMSRNIPEHKLNGKVSVCAFITVVSQTLNYTNSAFNEDYEGISFELRKGNIIAVGGQVNIEITKETEELAKIPSIFTVCRSAEDAEDGMKINIDGEKIVLTLSDKSFRNYKILAGDPLMLPVIHSVLIVPALIYTFETLKKDGTGEYENQRWYKSIEKNLLRSNIKLNSELLENVPSYELAQKSLDLPVDRAFEALASYDISDEGDE
ncbi:MAG: hypothetical protein NC078_11050 [Ruminococcus sp.]|nr:hypothetical protein [Ruminococcus sp.]